MNKKIMVCVDLNNESIDLIKKNLESWYWEKIHEVHFVHGFQIQNYADLFYLASYPPESQYEEVENSVKQVMKGLEEQVANKATVIRECIIASSPRQVLADYAHGNKIDVMVVGTRAKHGFSGLFSSSFAEYMVKHAPCELKIIREQKARS